MLPNGMARAEFFCCQSIMYAVRRSPGTTPFDWTKSGACKLKGSTNRWESLPMIAQFFLEGW
jgi:hypothetical protein